ncbi:hypothetical protein [uncultured Cutibacterium sp.]|jgi:hypothetical protein|uniref:hypothetical protein n=1 Tax=uncultured Cutibacterium sp. TaxID=1912223 RepID=UPI0020627E10|nr:hypothetical protein [uncultured Cutibacterium sp.]MDU1580837.1 hypothetical protein [Cutibacterium granulosum]DAT57876.1 MAG TPA: hypothetical protein [Caudoviricetes sp.]
MHVSGIVLHAVWQWLPARPDRRRAIHPSIAAAELGITAEEATVAMWKLEHDGMAARSRRGQLYRIEEVNHARRLATPDAPGQDTLG